MAGVCEHQSQHHLFGFGGHEVQRLAGLAAADAGDDVAVDDDLAALDLLEGIDQAGAAAVPEHGDLGTVEVEAGGAALGGGQGLGLGGDTQRFQQGPAHAADRLHPPVQHQGPRGQGRGRKGDQQYDPEDIGQAQSSSSTTTGTWSDGLSMSRASRWVSIPMKRSAAWGESRWKSMRMPWSRCQAPA